MSRKYSFGDVAKIRQWLADGRPTSWIAHELGTNTNNLKQILHRYDLKVSRPASSRRSQLREERERSIAERLAILQGLEPAPEESLRAPVFSDEQLRSWVSDPELFFRELLGVSLYPYQLEMLYMLQRHRRAVLCCGRGVGKSYFISLWLLYRAVVLPSQKCLVIAPSDRQAKLLLEYVHGFIAGNDALFRSVDFKKTSVERITFKNQSWIAPLGSTSFLRGFQNIDLLILDEAAYVENPDKLWTAILPMLKSGTGQFVVSSTPNIVGDRFHQAWLDPSFVKVHVPLTMSARFKDDELEQFQKDLSPYQYATEVLAEFVEGSNTFFSPELVNRVMQRYDFGTAPSSSRIYCGIDIGRYKDASVLVFVEHTLEGVRKIVYAKEIINTPLTQQVQIIKSLCDVWQPKIVCIERNGLSIHTVEELQKSGLPIQPFVSTIESKEKAYTHLLRLMEQDKVIIPMHPRLLHQLKNFRYEVTNTGRLKLHHSTEMVGDDWPDALCFAAWATRDRKPLYYIAGGGARR